MKQTTPRGPKKDPPGRLAGDIRISKLKKMFAGRDRNKKCSARQCKVYVAHKKPSKTRNICKFCFVLLHKVSCFEK
jgi:hypothetical protein